MDVNLYIELNIEMFKFCMYELDVHAFKATINETRLEIYFKKTRSKNHINQIFLKDHKFY